ncbi:MAG TPA: Asp-tRNA(Asn)/Glu-tRNA(Gln) amidotransferase subunit GatA, partial [Candidatus Nanopusillus sp.]|nr:Asp-tRNA(Asn)/Glu-tRNA(Gln) amidotransferase subunit GatA [Candidatus Nanopusillus sp.]
MFTKEIIEDARSDPINHFEKIRKNIERNENEVNSFITLLLDEAEKEIKQTKEGKLAYLLIAIKDNILVEGIKTTAGSKMLKNYIAPFDATVIKNIKKEGGIIIGKTNMDEFACGSDGTTSAFGPTRNPLDLEKVPGGSSSGSAAVLAAEFADLALGSDTGGSIRNPSAFCSIFGFKPTYGIVSRYGLIDMAMSLDQIGPMAKDTYGLALLMDVISGKDIYDPTTIRKPTKSFTEIIENFKDNNLKGKKVVYAREFLDYTEDKIKRKFFNVIDYLNSLGLEIIETSLPEIEYAVPTYYLVVPSEFASAMQRYDGLKYGYRKEVRDIWNTIMESRKVLGREVKRRIFLGTFITSREEFGKWYKKAVLVRLKIRKRLLELFKKYDYLVSPTMPVLPWRIGEIQDPLTMYQMDVLTVLANLVGIPSGSVPIAKSVGFQV